MKQTYPSIPKRFTADNAPASQPDRYTGQLYQFRHPQELREGTYVVIDGPHDTFGVVLSAHAPQANSSKPGYLHVVRGIRRQPGHTPVVRW